jgi:hypothetical protein
MREFHLSLKSFSWMLLVFLLPPPFFSPPSPLLLLSSLFPSLSYINLGNTFPLLFISGACQGVELKLEAEVLTFGPVVKGGYQKKKRKKERNRERLRENKIFIKKF